MSISREEIESHWKEIDKAIDDIYEVQIEKNYSLAAFLVALIKLSSLLSIRLDISKEKYIETCKAHHDLMKKSVEKEKVVPILSQ